MKFAVGLLVAAGRCAWMKLQLPCPAKKLKVPQGPFVTACVGENLFVGCASSSSAAGPAAAAESRARELHEALQKRLRQLGGRRHLEASHVDDLDDGADGERVLAMVRLAVPPAACRRFVDKTTATEKLQLPVQSVGAGAPAR
jgi:hypothetical protein